MPIPPAITLRPLPPSSLCIDVAPEPTPAPDPDPTLTRAWESLRATNPRLHDGPIWLVDTAALARDSADLVCHRSTYKHLATANMLNRPIRALGVCGLVIGRDITIGAEHILFGRRSSDTRIYGGLWENAPSGTVDARAHAAAPLDLPHLITALADEGLEELGIDLRAEHALPLATLEDAQACSLDIVLHIDLHQPVNPRHLPCAAQDHGRWEYIDAAWIARDQLADWTHQAHAAISPPTLGLLEHLGWLD